MPVSYELRCIDPKGIADVLLPDGKTTIGRGPFLAVNIFVVYQNAYMYTVLYYIIDWSYRIF